MLKYTCEKCGYADVFETEQALSKAAAKHEWSCPNRRGQPRIPAERAKHEKRPAEQPRWPIHAARPAPPPPMAQEVGVCKQCAGAGWVFLGEGRDKRIQSCDCRRRDLTAASMQRARIPRRYEHCNLQNFETNGPRGSESLRLALLKAERFTEDYPIEKRGLVFCGPAGVGKTHLAVGVLHELMKRGIPVLFYEYGELLTLIRSSYNSNIPLNEMDILRPVIHTEILLLDELGTQRVSDWVWDVVGYIINARYNEDRTTIFTTNYYNEPQSLNDYYSPDMSGQAERAMRRETLGDRITERLRSRLNEMCRFVEMDGVDRRLPALRSRTVSEAGG
jgi:DNA replication protein DnaC